MTDYKEMFDKVITSINQHENCSLCGRMLWSQDDFILNENNIFLGYNIFDNDMIWTCYKCAEMKEKFDPVVYAIDQGQVCMNCGRDIWSEEFLILNMQNNRFLEYYPYGHDMVWTCYHCAEKEGNIVSFAGEYIPKK